MATKAHTKRSKQITRDRGVYEALDIHDDERGIDDNSLADEAFRDSMRVLPANDREPKRTRRNG